MDKLTMTVPEIAQALGVSKPIAYDLVNQEDFPSIRLGRRIIVPIDSFKKWMERNAERKFSINQR